MVVKKGLLAFALALLICNMSTSYAAQVLFTPAIIARQEFTDNLFLSYQDEVDDSITVAGFDLDGQVLWRTAGLELHYIPTYNFYAENDNLNYWRHEASFYAWKQFQRNTRLELRDTYLRTNDPIDESAPVALDGQAPQPIIGIDTDRRGRNEYYTNETELRLSHQFGVEDRVYAAYRYTILRDVDPLPGALVDDNDVATPLFGLAYHFTQRWALEFDSSYANRNYVDRNDRTQFDANIRFLHSFDRAFSIFVNYHHTVLDYDQDTDEDYNIHEPGIGFRYTFSENMHAEMGVSYYVQDFETSEDENGFNINSDIYKRWSFRTAYFLISGGSGQQIEDYGSRDNGLDQYAQCRIEVGYNLTSRLLGTLFSDYRYDKYPNQIPERNQHTTRAGGTIDWQALQWMMVGLSYTFSDVNSDIQTDEYTENRAMLTIRIVPSSPIRLN